MNEEEKFDELLSSKLSERDFPFDEVNWDEAERLIIKQERLRKITRFALVFSAGIAAGVLIMLPFLINTNNALPIFVSSKSKANQNPITQSSISPTVNNDRVTTNNTINQKEEKLHEPIQSAVVIKETPTHIRVASSNIFPIAKTPNKNSSLSVASINKETHKLKGESNSIASVKEKPIYADTRNTKEAIAIEKATNESSAKPAINGITENAAPINSIVKTENNIPATTTAANKNNTENTVISSNISKVSTTNSTLPVTTITRPTKNSLSDSAVPKPQTNSSNNIPPPPLLPGTQPNYTNNDNPTSNILSVYAGGNYSFGWKDNGEKEGSGITPWAGFNFTHYFTNDISASLGVGYSELNHLNETYTSSMMQYDFGANATITTITPQVVYYIAFPLKLQYNLDSKNMFGVGLDYLLMLTTSSILTTGQQTSFGETTGTSEKQNGYTQGFSNSNIQLTLAYTRMLTGRFGISAEYYYDFDYVENNTVPGINQSAKNSGLRLVLSYQLMK
jgi:hypothetical protein